MVRNLHRPQCVDLTDAQRLRAEADGLLKRLMVNREASERRHAQAGWSNAMRQITGRTALDEAISATRDMISHVDSLIADLCEVVDQEEQDVTARRDQPMMSSR